MAASPVGASLTEAEAAVLLAHAKHGRKLYKAERLAVLAGVTEAISRKVLKALVALELMVTNAGGRFALTSEGRSVANLRLLKAPNPFKKGELRVTRAKQAVKPKAKPKPAENIGGPIVPIGDLAPDPVTPEVKPRRERKPRRKPQGDDTALPVSRMDSDAEGAMNAQWNRRGAALPLTLLTLSISVVAVLFTMGLVSAERRIGSDARAQLGAFHVAQSGLSRFLANSVGHPSGNTTVVYTDLPGGTARVSLMRIRDSARRDTTICAGGSSCGSPYVASRPLPAIYLLTSTGTNTTATAYDAKAPPAERTVATYVHVAPAPLNLHGTFTGLAGIDSDRPGTWLTGVDRCHPTVTPYLPRAAVPNGGATGRYFTDPAWPAESVKVLGTSGPFGTAHPNVKLDWNGIVNANILPSTHGVSWPTPTQMNRWPVIRRAGNFTLPAGGKGILIVTGNLIIPTPTPVPARWDGLILVGGTLTNNSDFDLYGAVMAGLNVKLGITTPFSTLSNDATMEYDSCALHRALLGIGSLQRIRNGWTDNYPSY